MRISIFSLYFLIADTDLFAIAKQAEHDTTLLSNKIQLWPGKKSQVDQQDHPVTK
jgi:hypothetical protein